MMRSTGLASGAPPASAAIDLALGWWSAGGSARARDARRPDEGPDLPAVRVLVVEDETLVALNLAAMIEDLGAEVCDTVSTGAAAVRRARALRPRVAVVDVRLKDGETAGIDAARTMAEELGVAIVFATAHSDPPTVAAMEAVPGSERLTKPYDARRLAAALHRALQRQERGP